MKKTILFFFLFPLLTIAQKKRAIDTITVSIKCDSIYTKKRLSVLLVRYEYEEEDGYENEKNSVFILNKKINGIVKEVYRDTIFSKMQQIDFIDFNGDDVKDILVQNTSSARSSWTYTLYLVNPKDYTLRKIKGFDQIPSPTYNSEYDIVEGYILSGEDYTSFYKIIKNHVYDYKIYASDNHQEDDDGEYEKAIQKILKRNKTLFKAKHK